MPALETKATSLVLPCQTRSVVRLSRILHLSDSQSALIHCNRKPQGFVEALGHIRRPRASSLGCRTYKGQTPGDRICPVSAKAFRNNSAAAVHAWGGRTGTSGSRACGNAAQQTTLAKATVCNSITMRHQAAEVITYAPCQLQLSAATLPPLSVGRLPLDG